MKHNTFLVLDFGSQLTQLIARRLRELNFYSEIHPFDLPIEKIRAMKPAGIILSGGPNSVYEEGSPKRPVAELVNVAPVLGICYGMQLICFDMGGRVSPTSQREYGYNTVHWERPLRGFVGVPQDQKVWMSHGDVVKEPAKGCEFLAFSEGRHPAVMHGPKILGLQFHPEVAHTEHGDKLLKFFAADMCGAEPTWEAPQILEMMKQKILAEVKPREHILVGLSGGVDSSVVATLLTKTLGADRVHCVFVNNGLLRENEFNSVMAQYNAIGLNVKGVDASRKFISELKGKTDPEQKRKTIGRVFIEVFEASLDPKFNIEYLAQGTLYPDVIESVSFKGPSQTIKSHHNVGGLPERMRLKLLEPVRELFKDEVRRIGKELGLPTEMLGRHPFPGPGLAIRIMGEVTEDSLAILRKADHIFISKLRERGIYDKIWQAFCVLLPIKTVGVQGDGRTYEQVLALRAVTSSDGMTADWYPFEFKFLQEVSNEITNQVRGINRVVYDISSKPPATIEWE